MKPQEYELLIQIGQALHCDLDLEVALSSALPLLTELLAVHGVAVAIAAPLATEPTFLERGTLPARGQLRRRLARVLSGADQGHWGIAGAFDDGPCDCDRGQLVMLEHTTDLGFATALFRARGPVLSEHELRLLQRLTAHFAQAIRNHRQHAAVRRGAHTALGVADEVAVLVLDEGLRQVDRTAAVRPLLAEYFPGHAALGTTPEAIVAPLREHAKRARPGKFARTFRRAGSLRSLVVRYVPLRDEHQWALVMTTRGMDAQLEARLTPRLREIADCLLQGMSNEEIAARDARAVATVKQQASEIYRRLDVDGRRGLIRLVAGIDVTDDQPQHVDLA